MPSVLHDLTTILHAGSPLLSAQTTEAGHALLNPEVSEQEKCDFLKALSAKGETPSEIAALVECFLEYALDPGIQRTMNGAPLLDVCGTGGDKAGLFNVSTTAMFILAAAGVKVAKHGNRGITSKSGGADVLEELGIKIDLEPTQFVEALGEAGVAFLFAPRYHPAFKLIAPIRKQLAEEGIRTVFNILGPLLNPARPARQLLGVYHTDLAPSMASILATLGREKAWVLHGTTMEGYGLDETSISGPTRVVTWDPAVFSGLDEFTLYPEFFGFPPHPIESLRGGSGQENAVTLQAILQGKEQGSKRDLVVINAAAALVVAGAVNDIAKGLDLAKEILDQGAAWEHVLKLKDVAPSN